MRDTSYWKWENYTTIHEIKNSTILYTASITDVYLTG